jgi:hypothetical protein
MTTAALAMAGLALLRPPRPELRIEERPLLAKESESPRLGCERDVLAWKDETNLIRFLRPMHVTGFYWEFQPEFQSPDPDCTQGSFWLNNQ